MPLRKSRRGKRTAPFRSNVSLVDKELRASPQDLIDTIVTFVECNFRLALGPQETEKVVYFPSTGAALPAYLLATLHANSWGVLSHVAVGHFTYPTRLPQQCVTMGGPRGVQNSLYAPKSTKSGLEDGPGNQLLLSSTRSCPNAVAYATAILPDPCNRYATRLVASDLLD